MQSYFYELADHVGTLLHGDEVFTATFGAEDSDFVRFNHDRVRQAGQVQQRHMALDLVRGQRHAEGGITLSGEPGVDRTRRASLIEVLRGMLPGLPEDPHLLYSTEIHSSERHGENLLPPGPEAVRTVLRRGKGRDLVGIYSAGGIYAGFANSLGQRNWYSTYSFNVDWSLYHQQDKAVKEAYAGFAWDDAAFDLKMNAAKQQLGVLGRAPRTIAPGKYRVFLSPVAMCDILGTLSWGGFGLKDHRTKQTTLLKMSEDGACLH